MSNSLTAVLEEETGSPILLRGGTPNLAGAIIQPERFNRRALGDLADGQGSTTQPAGAESICISSVYACVYVILCHLG